MQTNTQADEPASEEAAPAAAEPSTEEETAAFEPVKKKKEGMPRTNSVMALNEAPPEPTKLMVSADRLPVESGMHQAVFFLRPDPKARLELEELQVCGSQTIVSAFLWTLAVSGRTSADTVHCGTGWCA